MIAEHRKAHRKWISAPAVLAGPDGTVISGCRMLDISETGARVRLLKPATVRGAVALLLSGDGSLRRDGKIAWQTGRILGIAFDRRYAAFKPMRAAAGAS